MPKGYRIARVDVHDPEPYRQYVAANAEPFARFGGHFLVRAGRFEAVEGAHRRRNVVIEFPSYPAALDCWNSPSYRAALAQRVPAATADVLGVDGFDGPQPGD